MYNSFGVEWDINSAVFWIVVAQAVFLLIAIVIIIVLIARSIAAKREAKRTPPPSPSVVSEEDEWGSFEKAKSGRHNSRCVLTHVTTTPDFSDKVEAYVDGVMKQALETTENAMRQQPVYNGPFYYADLTPGAQDPPDRKPTR